MRTRCIEHVLPVCILLLMVGFILPVMSVAAQDTSPSIQVGSSSTSGESEGEQQLTFEPRAPLVAAALSAIAPAGGQYYNKEPIKGLVVTAGEGLATFLLMYVIAHEKNAPAAFLLPPAVYAASIIDAGVSAHLYNRRMYAQGYKAVLPAPHSKRFAIGTELAWPIGLLGSVEWRIAPALGVEVEHAFPVITSWNMASNQVSVKYYFNSARREQIFIGIDAGRNVLDRDDEQIQIDFFCPTVGFALYNPQQTSRFTFSIAANDWQTYKYLPSYDTKRTIYGHMKYGWAFLF